MSIQSQTQVTNVFKRNLEALDNDDYDLVANEGSSSSTKTYSLLQLFIYHSFHTEKPFFLEVCAVTVPHVVAGAMHDFLDILEDLDLYSDESFNKTMRSYKLNGSTFKFSAYPTAKKAKGPRRDYLIANEADLFDERIFLQLNIRTRRQTFVDYNPAYDEHWLFNRVDNDEGTKLIKSTYRDNPFLTQRQINELEKLKKTSPLHWAVYGEGKRTSLKEGKIYNDWELGQYDDSLPFLFGLDYGSNPDPTTLIKVAIDNKLKIIYIRECFYACDLSANDIQEQISKYCAKNDLIIADTSDKILNSTFRRAGYNIKSAKKGNKSERIKILQSYKFVVTEDSLNLQKELRNYIWNDKRAGLPIDAYDHCLDALSYAYMYAYLIKKKAFNLK